MLKISKAALSLYKNHFKANIKIYNLPAYQFGFFDSFKKNLFEKESEQNRSRYEENLRKSEKARKQKEGETIIISDEKLEAERKKQEEEEEFDPDRFTTKEAYIKMLRRDREKMEAEDELSKETVSEIENRKQREYEVELSQIDSAKIAAQNINIRPVETFSHPDELFYFINGLNVRLSEENMIACLNGFLCLSDQLNEADLESSAFQKFLSITLQNLKTISDDGLLLLIAKFGDLYCISDSVFWQNLEMKLSRRVDKLKTDDLIEALEHFSHQKEGTEFFFDKIEMAIHARLGEEEGILWPKLTMRQLVRISLSYFAMKRGTKEFFSVVQTEIEKRVGAADIEDLIQIASVYKNSQRREVLFQKLESQMWQHVEHFDFTQACRAASGFGFALGTTEFYVALELKVSEHLSKNIASLKKQDFDLIVNGFLHTCRGSKVLFQILRNKFLEFLPQITIIEAANIIKSLHLVEFDDKEINKKYEDRIIYHLQGVAEITLPELLEITKSYTITRIGSRKLYKLLEIVIIHRIPDIQNDHKMLKELFVYYSKSGLCSEELMAILEKYELLN